jgi:hypothetical protein
MSLVEKSHLATPAPGRKHAPPAKSDWKRFVGWAKDDPTYEQALKIGAEYRRSMTWEREERSGDDADS